MDNTNQTKPPFVLLLTDPAGAGKTTVARARASGQQRPTAHILLDDVCDFVKSGYANPSDGWNAATEQQLILARQGCATLAINYVNAGFLCIIDDAIFPEWERVSYSELRVPGVKEEKGYEIWLLLPGHALAATNKSRQIPDSVTTAARSWLRRRRLPNSQRQPGKAQRRRSRPARRKQKRRCASLALPLLRRQPPIMFPGDSTRMPGMASRSNAPAAGTCASPTTPSLSALIWPG